MKKYVVILLSIIMTVTLVACGRSTDTDNSIETSPQNPTSATSEAYVEETTIETTITTTELPKDENIDTDICMISLGSSNSAAIKGGKLYVWGSQTDGQLGDGNVALTCKYPSKIMDDYNFKYVCLGGYHSAAITEDGDLYLWGSNKFGQLGDGTFEDKSTPTQIMKGLKFKCVSLGGSDTSIYGSFSAAVTEDGDLYMWGCNKCGQLGDGTTNDSSIPIKIMEGYQFKSIDLSAGNSAAITTSGDLYLWGNNHAGSIGNGSGKSENEITPNYIMGNVSTVSLGSGFSAAITNNGKLYAWGTNCDGQLGVDKEQYLSSSTPIEIMSDVKFKSVSLGSSHAGAIDENGNLYTWGNNNMGQLGDGTTTKRYEPKIVLSDVEMIDFGDVHSAAVSNGELFTWGWNSEHQLGNGEIKNSYVPIEIALD